MGTIYTAVLDADTGAAQAAQDLFQIFPPTDTGGKAATRFKVREIRIGQQTEFGDAQAELVQVKLIAWHSADSDTGFGGTKDGGNDTGGVLTPRPIHRWLAPTDTGGGATTRGVMRVRGALQVQATDTGDTGVAGHTMLVDSMNVAAGWWYYPPEEEMVILDNGDAFTVRLSAFADQTTLNGTIVYEEVGELGVHK